MYKIGEFLLYGSHGVCEIVDIIDKRFTGQEKKYYVLHPIKNPDLKLYFPVDGNGAKLKTLLSEEEANDLLQVFKQPAKQWIEKTSERNQYFQKVVASGDRKQIAEMIKMLMQRKFELEKIGKKLSSQETKLLQDTSAIFYNEFAMSLSISKEKIQDQIEQMILSI